MVTPSTRTAIGSRQAGLMQDFDGSALDETSSISRLSRSLDWRSDPLAD